MIEMQSAAALDRPRLIDEDGLEPLAVRPETGARLIGVSRAKMYQLLAQGAIPSIKIGGSRRIPLEALRQWVAEQVT